MTITIVIEERESGDVAIGFKEPSGYVSTRENYFITELMKVIKQAVFRELPRIVKGAP